MSRKYFVTIFVTVLIVLLAYAQQDSWSINQIKYKTPIDIINEHDKAKQHWSELSQEQKESTYRYGEGLKKFSEQFASEKGIKNLDLSAGSPYYDGSNLVNGDTKISISTIKNAEVTSLTNGGFKIKYSGGEDLSNLDFYSSNSGITIEGNNLKFDEGLLSSGTLTMYSPEHLKIESNSVFITENVEFTTTSQVFDIYYGRMPKEYSFIQIDDFNDRINIAGDDLTINLHEGHQFKELYVDGEVTVIDGDFKLEFDGEGNSYQEIPIEDPESAFVIIDQEAPDKRYVLFPEDELIEDDGFLEGFGGCGMSGVTGNSILEITGMVQHDICKGPLVKTGANYRKGFGRAPYNAELLMNAEQANKAKDEFISKYGREPNLNDDKELKEISKLINQHVSDMKMKLTFLDDKSHWESTVRTAIYSGLNNADISSDSLTSDEKKQIDAIVPLVTVIKKGDAVEYQLSGDMGVVIAYPKNGAPKEVPVSGRLIKALMQNFYDRNINDVKEQSRDLLSSYYERKITQK